MPVNSVVISGSVKRIFDAREVAGKPARSAILTQDLGNDKSMDFTIGGFGEFATKQFDSLSTGDRIIVQGRYSARSYKKDDQWVNAVEVSVNHIEHMGDTGGFTANEFVPVAAGNVDDSFPF